ncbi:MAG: mannosyltransferase family protein [Gaiellaceae bacterium]
MEGSSIGMAATGRAVLRGTSGRVRSLPPPVVVFVGSRLLIWATALYAWIWFVPRPVGPASGGLGYLTAVWARADSHWFIAIAKHGYQRNGSAVFYPLYPLAIGLLGRAFGGHFVIAGIVISLVCCAGAFILLYRLALPRLGVDGARRALLYLALFPMALFLQAVYSESLYLVCCLAAFVLAERRRWLPAGLVTGLAILTRVAGLALLPAMVLLAWRSPERRRAIASLISAPALAALYPLWLQLKLHAPFAAVAGEAGWNRHFSVAGPLGGLWYGLQAAWAGIEQLATGDRAHAFWAHSNSDPLYVAAHNLEDLAFLIVFVWLGVEAWRRFGAPYGIFVLGSLAIPLSVPHAGYPLLSMPRFCLTLFPDFLALAAIATSGRRDRTILALSAVFLAVATVQWSLGTWVS